VSQRRSAFFPLLLHFLLLLHCSLCVWTMEKPTVWWAGSAGPINKKNFFSKIVIVFRVFFTKFCLVFGWYFYTKKIQIRY
jgi:hypothetical protein